MEHKGNVLVIGGGTEIYELSQRGLLTNIEVLVDLSMLKLDKVEELNGTASIGASVTLSQLEQHHGLEKYESMACLFKALHEIRPLQVKNTATVGGAISSCIPFFDLPVAIAVLDHVVEINGTNGTRSTPISSFQKDLLQPDLSEGEFVTRVLISLDGRSRSAFRKFAIAGEDWALVNCAVSVKVEGDQVSDARVVFGAVSNRLFVAERTADAIVGRRLDDDRTVELAIKALDTELTEPTEDSRASGKYRSRIAKVLLQDALGGVMPRPLG